MENVGLVINQQFKKPNSAIVMMPKVGKLTAVSRKIFNVILHKTQRQVNDLNLKGKIVEATHYFSARLDELVDPVERGGSNLTAVAKLSLLEMRRTEVDWEAPDANSGVIWSSMSLLSEAKIVKEGGILYAYWALPPGLLTVIADPQRFTPIDITQLSQLKTYTAVALYEICVRYKYNPSGVTSEHSLEWWVDALTQSPPKIDPKTKKPKLRLWSKFKNEQVKDAIDEINAKTDIVIELKQHSSGLAGKAVTSAQFEVKRKPGKSIASSRPKMSSEIAELAHKLGIPIGDISNLIGQGQSESVLKIAFAKLEDRINREDLAPVESKMAYLRTVLAEINGYVSSVPAVQTKTVVMPVVKALDDLPKALNYQEQRRGEIKDELLNLGKEGQKRYAEIAFGSLQKAGIGTAAIGRKLELGEWTNGILFSKMIEAYAVEQYGENWGVETESTCT